VVGSPHSLLPLIAWDRRFKNFAMHIIHSCLGLSLSFIPLLSLGWDGEVELLHTSVPLSSVKPYAIISSLFGSRFSFTYPKLV
jgi:hypothetical protein